MKVSAFIYARNGAMAELRIDYNTNLGRISLHYWIKETRRI